MPETRYKEVYEQGTGKLIAKEPYLVSDEQLEQEQRIQTRDMILAKGKKNWTMDDVKDLLEVLVKLML